MTTTLLIPQVQATGAEPETNAYPAEKVSASALFRGLSLDQLPTMAEREEYFQYVRLAFSALRDQAERQGIELKVSEEDILDELEFWRVPGFVWPYFVFTRSGGVALYWQAGPINLRFERLVGDKTGYRISSWAERIKPPKKIHYVDPEEYLQKTLPEIYTFIVHAAKKANHNWKAALSGGRLGRG